ncbi:hypothetical protein CI105_06575 [Candidatus Izimaplasma bacterium ZiA1]|uniref:LacI family DNA-binding transcriptional regulator n=1 Tax=Candidatus Izimoplasma sp. ZiA1 TaxID=2024899 RepID=UPI000BAA3926|nr:hypothetical protein CI105_06575 [Candidatus Izimaplasma bacterium ZiA1]
MPSIKDVAKQANVSIATVSRVLNNSSSVNEETKKIVTDAISLLGYKHQKYEQQSIKDKTTIIGLIVPLISTYYYKELIESMENSSIKSNFKLMIFNSEEMNKSTNEFIKMIDDYHIKGFICAVDSKIIDKFISLKIPLVTIDHVYNNNIPSVTSDNYQGGIVAAKKLLSLNLKNIIHIKSSSSLFTHESRTQGFIDQLEKNNVNSITLTLSSKTPDLIEIEKFIRLHDNVEGIFCSNDLIAISLINVLAKLNMDIPKDVNIIGYNNIHFCEISNPTLSTIAQPLDLMSLAAIKALRALIDNKPLQTIHEILPVTLIERDSTK